MYAIRSYYAFQLIDVREDYEWDICNLEAAGARLVPLQSLPEELDTFDREVPLIIHCRTGPRGTNAVAYLQSVGFDNAVRNNFV